MLPSLLFGCRVVQFYTNIPPIVFARLFGALLAAVAFGWLGPALWQQVAVLLVPCLPMLPMSMECRFLLPLHLVLYATLCFGWPTSWRPGSVPRRQSLVVTAVYSVFVVLCLYASATAQATLEFGPRALW